MSSTKILQPSCSPKKLTLLPTTGPRSSSTGDSRDVSDGQELAEGFGGEDGIVARPRRDPGTDVGVSLGAARGDREGPLTAKMRIRGQ